MTADAKKLKNRYHTTLSSAKCLVEQISSDPDWAWANNEENKGALEKAMKAASDSLTSFGKQFLVQEPSDLKKTYGENKLQVELEAFNRETLPKINELQSICKAKHNMHKNKDQK